MGDGLSGEKRTSPCPLPKSQYTCSRTRVRTFRKTTQAYFNLNLGACQKMGACLVRSRARADATTSPRGRRLNRGAEPGCQLSTQCLPPTQRHSRERPYLSRWGPADKGTEKRSGECNALHKRPSQKPETARASSERATARLRLFHAAALNTPSAHDGNWVQLLKIFL